MRKTMLYYFKGEYENDPVGLLAAEIIIHAITDWRDLVRTRAWENKYQSKSKNFDELRAFFKGEWCEFLMQNFDIESEAVLDLLESELAEAKLRPRRKRNIKIN